MQIYTVLIKRLSLSFFTMADTTPKKSSIYLDGKLFQISSWACQILAGVSLRAKEMEISVTRLAMWLGKGFNQKN